MNGFDEEERKETLEDLGLNVRFATAAERPSFYTEERVSELASGGRVVIDPTFIEFQKERANARVNRAFVERAIETHGEAFCTSYPETGGCVLPPGYSGEGRLYRPGAGSPPPGSTLRYADGQTVPRPRAPAVTDISAYLRSRFAEEALLKAKTAYKPDERERAELTEELARDAREAHNRAQEEAYYALTPTQRLRAGVTILPGGGVGPAVTSRGGR